MHKQSLKNIRNWHSEKADNIFDINSRTAINVWEFFIHFVWQKVILQNIKRLQHSIAREHNKLKRNNIGFLTVVVLVC